tara:strand:- start:322 stop:597 length:276 start_codon:yes stop_codon:yes gene_type:complete
VGALSLIAVDGAKNVPQGMWRAWTYMADPGTHSEARGTGFQFVSIGIALAGILLMAAILGFVVTCASSTSTATRPCGGRSRPCPSPSTTRA